MVIRLSQDNNSDNNGNQRLFVFPGGSNNKQNGQVWASRRLYRCPKCGNTRTFYGRVKVDATIFVTAVGAFEYDIAEYTIDETGKAEHIITHCAECGAIKIEEYEVNLQPEPTITNVTTGARQKIVTNVNPLPPHERDVEFTPDGQAVASSHHAYNETMFAEMGIELVRRKKIPYVPLKSDMFEDEPDF